MYANIIALLLLTLFSLPVCAQGMFCLVGKRLEHGAAFFHDSIAPQVVLGQEKLMGCQEKAPLLYTCDYKGMSAKFDLKEEYMEFDGKLRFDLRECRPV